MQHQKKLLTNTEWVVMEALWGREPQVLSEIIESIGKKVDWNYQTYASYLKVLHKKGFIGFNTRGRNKFYYAAVPAAECIAAETESIFQKMGSENARQLLLCMARETGISGDGQRRLESLIEELDAKESGE